VSKQNNENFSDGKIFPFATGVNGSHGAPLAENIFANFQKNLKRPQWDT
jgi:hypothetical protein